MAKENMKRGRSTSYTHTARVRYGLRSGLYTDVSTAMEEMEGEVIFIRPYMDSYYDWVGRTPPLYGREWYWLTEWLDDITPIEELEVDEEDEEG